jgi:hypothetical protein
MPARQASEVTAMTRLVLGWHRPGSSGTRPQRATYHPPLPAADGIEREPAQRGTSGLLRHVAAWFGPDDRHPLTADQIEAWQRLSGCGL